MTFSSRELALHAAHVVDQKGGEQVRVLQLAADAHSFDYVVLVTANSDRLTNALVEEVWHFCKRSQVPRLPVEGESGWMLIDCYEVIVHAMTPEKREFYDIDTLWPTAREVPWAKEYKALVAGERPASGEVAAKPRRTKVANRAKAQDAGDLASIPVPGPAMPKPRRRSTALVVDAPAKPARRTPTRARPVFDADDLPAPRAPAAKKAPAAAKAPAASKAKAAPAAKKPAARRRAAPANDE